MWQGDIGTLNRCLADSAREFQDAEAAGNCSAGRRWQGDIGTLNRCIADSAQRISGRRSGRKLLCREALAGRHRNSE